MVTNEISNAAGLAQAAANAAEAAGDSPLGEKFSAVLQQLIGGSLEAVLGGVADLGLVQVSAATMPVKEVKEEAPQEAIVEEDEGKEEVELAQDEKADKETDQGGAEVAVVQQAPVQAAAEAVTEEGAVTEELVEWTAASDAKLLKTGGEGEEASPEFQLLKAQTAPETAQRDVGKEGAGNQVAAQAVTQAAEAPGTKVEAGKAAQTGAKAESESYYAIQRALEAVDGAPKMDAAPQAQVAPAAAQAKPEAGVKAPNPGLGETALMQGMTARLTGGNEAAAQQGPTKGAEGGNGVTVAGLGNQANAEKAVGAKAKAAAALPTKDQQKVVEQVKELLQKAIQTRDGNTITVKLNPQELGQMTVKVTQRESQVYARIIPESPEVEQALRARAPEVMQALTAAGLKPDQVHVSIGRERTDAEAFQFQQFMSRSDGGTKQGGREARGETMTGEMWTLGGSEAVMEEFVDSGWVA